MRKYFGLVVGLAVLAGASLTARAETYSAFLTPTQETPAVASTATGRAIVKIDATAGTVTFTVVYSGLTSNQILAHIHAPAPVGTAAPVIITFPNPGGTSGTITGTAAITPTQIAQIRSGQGYVNVHSANFTGGEVRGQLAKLRPVDYEGDGRMDYSVLRFPNVAPPGVAQITYWNLLSSGGSTTSLFGDANSDFPAPGDYDGDGKGDICIFRSDENDTPGVATIFMILRSSDNTFTSSAFGVTGDQVIARDFDGDGITNMAVYRRGAFIGAQSIFFYRTPAGATVYAPFGMTGDTAGGSSDDTPVPADYDGDGKVDLAVYRFGFGGTTDNMYIILRSSDNVVQYQRWGNFNSDYILPGDYDGDGKADFMVGRTGATAATPMDWWLLRTSDGGTSVRRFGISSDFPTQGDYDGDGKADIAVFRRGATAGSQSNFYVLRSFDNVFATTPWGVREDFPVATFDAR